MNKKDQWQKVNMTIHPEELNGSFTCAYDGTDNCYVPAGLLKEEEILTITVQCEDDCSYSLTTHESDLEHLYPGQDDYFMFGKEANQLYHVELTGEDFEEFRLVVSPRATINPFGNMKIYGKYGGDSQPT